MPQDESFMGTLGPELLTRLLDEYSAPLALYARQWCNAPEDVVQDAFLQLMRQRLVPENLVGWLYRVVRNGAISASRSQARRTRHESAAARGTEAWFTTNHDDVVDAAAVTQALAELALEQREAIVLRIWGGLSFEQIAELTQGSTSTAYRRYVAGLAAIRERHMSCTTQMNLKK
jgi:RNA polymerase sigma factor (sigma-70 family)